MAAPDAVTATDLATWLRLGDAIEADTAALALSVAAGWIAGRSSLSPMPDVVPLDIWAAWLELAGIAYDNPTSMTSNQAGEEITMWAGGSQDRRAAILAALESAYPRTTSGPLGAFPMSNADGPWPDPSSDVNTFGRLSPWWWGR
jgi:hypothetical protein